GLRPPLSSQSLPELGLPELGLPELGLPELTGAGRPTSVAARQRLCLAKLQTTAVRVSASAPCMGFPP
ncbi:MAG: hypothetical protein J2P50_07570, partial [Hyphomicrobiaceae bacterium]|nr:hypothetical protein [Hyphomicrobiaceae bacterium]